MSTNAKPAAVKTATEEKVVAEVPAQSQVVQSAVQSAVAADTMLDALDLSSDQMTNGFKVRVLVDENGNRSLEVVEESESKAKKMVAGAKGLFNRNKKLVLASAGLLATSVLLKVLANRQTELEPMDPEAESAFEASRAESELNAEHA